MTTDIKPQWPHAWIAWIALVYFTWFLIVSLGPGWVIYQENWHIALVMILGSAVAGFTPEGGGAIAYPILSIWFSLPATVARDFGLAIQSIGMTSASIYILASGRRPWRDYRHVPMFVLFNMLGLVIGFASYGLIDVKIIQMIFVSLALSFILAIWSSRRFGDQDDFEPNSILRWLVLFAMCFSGGFASSLFGTGADMLLFICLSCWFAMREKLATDISILTMAAISIFGILIRTTIIGDVSVDVFHMWLAAVPVVLLGAPLGNWLLQKVRKETLLIFLLAFNLWTFCWWISKNITMIWPAILSLAVIYVTMTSVMLCKTKK